MPSQSPKPATADRPTLQARATSLRAQPARVMPMPAPGADPKLATLVAEHDALNAAANASGLSDETAEALIAQVDTRFRQACAIPARSPADLLVKLHMILPDVRQQISDVATDLHAALDSIETDAAALWGATPPASALPPPALQEASDDPPSTQFLIDRLNTDAQSMRELLSLQSIAETIKSVAFGLAAAPRAAPGQGRLTAAGRFAYWIAALASDVEDHAQAAARSRSPSNADEAEFRLMAVAYSITSNGDPSEIRALARDFEALAQGIEAEDRARG